LRIGCISWSAEKVEFGQSFLIRRICAWKWSALGDTFENEIFESLLFHGRGCDKVYKMARNHNDTIQITNEYVTRVYGHTCTSNGNLEVDGMV
jgi:hypothetical protein